MTPLINLGLMTHFSFTPAPVVFSPVTGSHRQKVKTMMGIDLPESRPGKPSCGGGIGEADPPAVPHPMDVMEMDLSDEDMDGGFVLAQ